jgi:NADH:ubiquinone oxidoreductase subunit 3 (subunit A)
MTMTNYLEIFILISVLTLITLAFMFTLFYVFGLTKAPKRVEVFKTDPYSGGKALEHQSSFFKSTFFQFAIYFLIFDVVAFITAMAAFTGEWQIINNGSINTNSLYLVIYLVIILSLFTMLPKSEEEII